MRPFIALSNLEARFVFLKIPKSLKSTLKATKQLTKVNSAVLFSSYQYPDGIIFTGLLESKLKFSKLKRK